MRTYIYISLSDFCRAMDDLSIETQIVVSWNCLRRTKCVLQQYWIDDSLVIFYQRLKKQHLWLWWFLYCKVKSIFSKPKCVWSLYLLIDWKSLLVVSWVKTSACCREVRMGRCLQSKKTSWLQIMEDLCELKTASNRTVLYKTELQFRLSQYSQQCNIHNNRLNAYFLVLNSSWGLSSLKVLARLMFFFLIIKVINTLYSLSTTRLVCVSLEQSVS